MIIFFSFSNYSFLLTIFWPLNIKVLQSSTISPPRDKLELDKLSCSFFVQGNELQWKWILLLTTVFQLSVKNLGPWIRLSLSDMQPKKTYF